MDNLVRCEWVPLNDEEYVRYHDVEWGVPVHDDMLLFEFLVLEGAQAGLSWKTILHKRENYRKAFSGFDPSRVAEFGEERVDELASDSGIVRNRLKVKSAISNASAFLCIVEEYGTFDSYVWKFVGNRPKNNSWASSREVPSRTPESDRMSRDLRKRGFNFVGSTICYAFMQATGMVNDHIVGCFRHSELSLL